MNKYLVTYMHHYDGEPQECAMVVPAWCAAEAKEDFDDVHKLHPKDFVLSIAQKSRRVA